MTRAGFASLAGAAVLVLGTNAAAAPAAAAAASPSASAPSQVTLKVTPGPNGAPWTLKVENTSEEPVRIPADPRLLVLDITAPSPEPAKEPTKTRKSAKSSGPTTLRCILPDDARPHSDEASELVVPAKRSWSATFDPLFYCFGARERRALVAGHEIKARFGWPGSLPRPGAKPAKPAPPKPPFAVAPVGAAVGKFAPAKAIEADAFTLAETIALADAPASEREGASAVSLAVPEALDAARGAELSTTVTLENERDRPITLLFRPDMLEFRVTSPSGSIWCGSARTIESPIRELFTTIPAKGKTQLSVLFTASCPNVTFDDPGIYRVQPRLDTTNASGRSIGLATWDGVAIAKTPLVVRVRTAKSLALPERPMLD